MIWLSEPDKELFSFIQIKLAGGSTPVFCLLTSRVEISIAVGWYMPVTARHPRLFPTSLDNLSQRIYHTIHRLRLRRTCRASM